MPIYMDRHDIPKEIKAEHVAEMHQIDLKIEHKFGCRGLTYWCDEERNTAFCLIEAPNKKAIQDMHNQAHGEFPHSIIEVDKKIVESFLGRIEDPVKAKNTKLNIINDPAFRVIMVLKTSSFLNRLEANQFSLFLQKFHNSVLKTFKHFKGSIVKRDNNHYLVSFKSVSNAVTCMSKIQSNFKYITPKFDLKNRRIKIALSAGSPVSEKETIFEEAITLATRMCDIVKNQLVISNEVRELYESENRNLIIDRELIKVLKPNEEVFLNKLMNFVEQVWNKPSFKVANFCKGMGYSKSQLYRKLIQLTGMSPNNFIREFRLHQALGLLHKQSQNISEIAYESGFNSPAYFSKCFIEKYGILPSKYIQQHKT
ncbi:nickel-binding protein [uncultured Lutibacter sp.]|uniref:nickel-binding protein n=1 Tax=uncultured Lutibacter sp. TaxID=437739 RepID=UPI002611B6B1|nr:nickel-binding protein [uncultured Lutibacter sp.]